MAVGEQGIDAVGMQRVQRLVAAQLAIVVEQQTSADDAAGVNRGGVVAASAIVVSAISRIVHGVVTRGITNVGSSHVKAAVVIDAAIAIWIARSGHQLVIGIV